MPAARARTGGARWRALAGALGILAVLATPLAADASEIWNKFQQLQNLNTLIGQSREQLVEYSKQITQLQDAIRQLDAQLGGLQRELAQQQARLDELEGQIERATLQLQLKELELDRRKVQLDRRTRFLYKSGHISTLSLAFSAGSFSDLLDRLFFMQDIVQADRRLVNQMKADKVAIENARVEIARKRDLQAAVVAQMREKVAQVEEIKARRESGLRSLRRADTLMRQFIADKERAAQEVAAEIARIRDAQRRAHSSGRFEWPMLGVLTQPFGCSPYWFEPYAPQCASKHIHTGLDIAADYGAAVNAADSGVAFVFPSPYGYGNHVIIVHQRNFTTLYAHLSRFAIGDGVAVYKGQVIGYEGSSGNSTGPHLHFEIRLNEAPVDPLVYLP
jgi:murein DD-endopeptidase MepM/ murein hydrolase activator NlpD